MVCRLRHFGQPVQFPEEGDGRSQSGRHPGRNLLSEHNVVKLSRAAESHVEPLKSDSQHTTEKYAVQRQALAFVTL